VADHYSLPVKVNSGYVRSIIAATVGGRPGLFPFSDLVFVRKRTSVDAVKECISDGIMFRNKAVTCSFQTWSSSCERLEAEKKGRWWH
jgi:hypothetical protein